MKPKTTTIKKDKLDTVADELTTSRLSSMTTAMSLNTRQDLKAKYEAVINKLKSIEDVSTIEYKTNGKFSYNPNKTVFGASTVIDHELYLVVNVNTLINIMGFLASKKQQYEYGVSELMLIDYPIFKWGNYTYDEWKHDLVLRNKVLTQSSDRNKLLNFKNQLEQYFTSDDKLERLLNSIDI